MFKIEDIKNKIICGDNLDITKDIPNNSISACLTDPPYGLGFMGKDWDTFKQENVNRPKTTKVVYKTDYKDGVPVKRKNPEVVTRDSGARRAGSYDLSRNPEFQQWFTVWAKEMLRITKPGGFLLCFGGTRTYHRLACAIEDAGWEIRDCMMWLYGCLSEDTEILTKKGWKPLHKTTKDDKIKVYDITDNIYKWETPQRWNVYRVHKDTAYRLKSDTTDQIVSREHRCLVEREGKLVFKQAWELSKVERVPVLPQDFYPMGKGFRKLLLPLLQWKSKSQAFDKIFSKWPRKETSGQGAKRGLKSSLEGRGDLFQKEGKLRQIQNKICQMSRRIFRYGSQRWLCNGTPPIDRTVTKQTSLENRGSSSQRPQSRKQFAEQPSAFQNKQSPQITRVEVSMIQYSGLMFCPTVSTGAFVARRNSKVFITGNSGFPKSHNISKAIDKSKGQYVKGKVLPSSRTTGASDTGIATTFREKTAANPQTELAKLWDGYGTALKPAWEPIIVAMKPLDGTFAHNAEVHGVAGLNIEGGRIGTDNRPKREVHALREDVEYSGSSLCGRVDGSLASSKAVGSTNQGRWPANLILDEEAGAMLDEQTGTRKSGFMAAGTKRQMSDNPNKNTYGKFNPDTVQNSTYGDSGGASRFFYCAKTSRKERNMGCGGLETQQTWASQSKRESNSFDVFESDGRPKTINKNNHPTVKPLALMKYLCTLLKMPSADQIILDPFLGSGTTGMACKELGINFIGIEKEREYCEIAVKRIAAVEGQEITLHTEPTLPVSKNVETFRTTKDFAGGSRHPDENLPHVSESRQSFIDEAVRKLKGNKK